jgi:hypothetical protein
MVNCNGSGKCPICGATMYCSVPQQFAQVIQLLDMRKALHEIILRAQDQMPTAKNYKSLIASLDALVKREPIELNQ